MSKAKYLEGINGILDVMNSPDLHRSWKKKVVMEVFRGLGKLLKEREVVYISGFGRFKIRRMKTKRPPWHPDYEKKGVWTDTFVLDFKASANLKKHIKSAWRKKLKEGDLS